MCSDASGEEQSGGRAETAGACQGQDWNRGLPYSESQPLLVPNLAQQTACPGWLSPRSDRMSPGRPLARQALRDGACGFNHCPLAAGLTQRNARCKSRSPGQLGAACLFSAAEAAMGASLRCFYPSSLARISIISHITKRKPPRGDTEPPDPACTVVVTEGGLPSQGHLRGFSAPQILGPRA